MTGWACFSKVGRLPITLYARRIMISFQTLLEVAEARWAQNNTGADAPTLAAGLPAVKTPDQLRQVSDDRYLSEMARCVFRAGFSWKVIDAKWPDFEIAFDRFNPVVVAHYSDDRLDQLVADKRIVRHAGKIKSVRENATFTCQVQQSHGSYAAFIADWPGTDIVGLWLELKKRGSRLGGNSGPMSLRLMGKDTFILTKDVIAALVNHKQMASVSPGSKRDLAAVQQVFNRFQEASGYPLAHISRIMSLTV